MASMLPDAKLIAECSNSLSAQRWILSLRYGAIKHALHAAQFGRFSLGTVPAKFACFSLLIRLYFR